MAATFSMQSRKPARPPSSFRFFALIQKAFLVCVVFQARWTPFPSFHSLRTMGLLTTKDAIQLFLNVALFFPYLLLFFFLEIKLFER